MIAAIRSQRGDGQKRKLRTIGDPQSFTRINRSRVKHVHSFLAEKSHPLFADRDFAALPMFPLVRIRFISPGIITLLNQLPRARRGRKRRNPFSRNSAEREISLRAGCRFRMRILIIAL